MKGQMKKLKYKVMIILAFLMTTMAPLAPVAVIGVVGVSCASTNGGDAVLINAEKSAEIGLSAIDLYVTIEQDNRAFLKTVSPEFEKISHQVQGEGMKAWENLRASTAVYKANRTPDNQANMTTLVAVLKSFQQIAQDYAARAASEIAKARKSGQLPPAK